MARAGVVASIPHGNRLPLEIVAPTWTDVNRPVQDYGRCGVVTPSATCMIYNASLENM